MLFAGSGIRIRFFSRPESGSVFYLPDPKHWLCGYQSNFNGQGAVHLKLERVFGKYALQYFLSNYTELLTHILEEMFWYICQ